MKTIWKFQLKVTDEQQVSMPIGAKVLSVQVQNQVPCLWAEVDPKNKTEKRTFYTYGTGHNITSDGINHVGSYQLENGDFVGHVFESIK